MADYIYTMEYRLTPDELKAVSLMQEVARHHEFNLYLTGGAIRDIITGFPIRDLDFTVQGNALKLQKDLEKRGATVVALDETTKTLHLLLPGKVRAEVSMARTEQYTSAGKPPVIHAAPTLADDMRRRDFTANAMALSLNEGSLGLLIDPVNGIADIEAKVLRLVSNYGFVEDPSRLIRAIRFSIRFGWTMEERTQTRYNGAKENSYIAHVADHALAVEVEQLAYEDDPLAVLRALDEQGWLKVLNPQWALTKIDVEGLEQMWKIRRQMTDLGYPSAPAAAVLYFLTHKLGETEISVIRRKIPRKDLVDAWKQVEGEAKDLAKQLSSKEAAHPSGVWTLLASARPDLVQFVATTSRQPSVVQKITNFLGPWREMQQKLPVTEMTELNITSAMPDYAKVAHQIFLQVIDGKLGTPAEINKFLKPLAPPPPPPPPPPSSKRGRAKGTGASGTQGKDSAAKGAAKSANGKGKAAKAEVAPATAPVPDAPQDQPPTAGATTPAKLPKAAKVRAKTAAAESSAGNKSSEKVVQTMVDTSLERPKFADRAKAARQTEELPVKKVNTAAKSAVAKAKSVAVKSVAVKSVAVKAAKPSGQSAGQRTATKKEAPAAKAVAGKGQIKEKNKDKAKNKVKKVKVTAAATARKVAPASAKAGEKSKVRAKGSGKTASSGKGKTKATAKPILKSTGKSQAKAKAGGKPKVTPKPKPKAKANVKAKSPAKAKRPQPGTKKPTKKR